jgi:hypothetical protein
VIQQVEFALTGTFQLDFDDPDRTRSGALSGNLATGTLPARMQLASSEGFACAPGQATTSFLLVSWTEVQGRLTGTYSGFACVGTITGTFDVKRE